MVNKKRNDRPGHTLAQVLPHLLTQRAIWDVARLVAELPLGEYLAHMEEEKRDAAGEPDAEVMAETCDVLIALARAAQAFQAEARKFLEAGKRLKARKEGKGNG